MRETVRVIGRAIVDGSRYLPIRNRAAALASTAKRNGQTADYFGQLSAIYNDFVRRWRYVKDPVGKELVARSPQQIFNLVMGGKSEAPGVGLGYGAGDCDDAAVAMGAQLMSIGIPVRIATIAPQLAGPGNMMSHVFVQGLIPGFGWVSADPVVYPKHNIGYTPPYSRIVFYGLDGEVIQKAGNVRNFRGIEGVQEMKYKYIPPINQWTDLSGFGDVLDPGYELPNFREVGIAGFGCYAEQYGIMDLGDVGFSLAAEVDTDETGRAWTPAIEIAPKDFNFVALTGAPYHGMLGLGDNGEPYYWNQDLGFFKKLFKKAKKKIKKGLKKLKRLGKKVLKKLPGGKMLLKLGQKVWKISKKLVRPLIKYVGPLAAKLAPVAALIPGYGPAISAALATTGKIAKRLKQFGVSIKKQKGDPVAKLKFKSAKQAAAFKAAIKADAAREMSKRGSVQGLSASYTPAGRRGYGPGMYVRPRRKAPMHRVSRAYAKRFMQRPSTWAN